MYFSALFSLFILFIQVYRVDDPRLDTTKIGPVISFKSAEIIKAAIDDAILKGASRLVDFPPFVEHPLGSNYLSPVFLLNVNPSMNIMKQETFGPVSTITKVSSDKEAIALIKDSEYGLSLSLWTEDEGACKRIASE